MKTDIPIVTRLENYEPPAFLVKEIDLKFELEPENTRVTSNMRIERNSGKGNLELDGEDIELISLKLDGKKLPKSAYRKTADKLTLLKAPNRFSLEITTICNPAANHSLMGLYVSGGRFCTQCEAQGFRRITYFPDRPDVLSVYKVRIEADKEAYPMLLANGNCVAEGPMAGGRHFAEWEDPFPKPCYLFALVAGKFETVSDQFITMSGRRIPLDIYVDPGDGPRALYAMDALKRAMRWDEEAYGREYDLDRFMVVAVRDFNFGAMENKGLNIFNSSLLLADEESATDLNFEHIESVIAHEYFHNWTGNRITCRDWFQLCLKEGFTVFRDQEFSADQRGHALQRIKDVKALRARQFVEDAGPLAHPVRPDNYMKIDNFYTATVYEKGAELIRMLRTIVGADDFRKGCDIYFDTLDGTAATVEQFLACFEQASGMDLSQFMRWYEQAGTPRVDIRTEYDRAGKQLIVSFKQISRPTPGQAIKKPLLIPIEIGLIDRAGMPLADDTVILADKSKKVVFNDIEQIPVLSVLRKFSAPVNIAYDVSTQDRLLQMKADPDLFNRWEAGQALARDLISDLAASLEDGNQPAQYDDLQNYLDAIGDIIRDLDLDDGLKALVLTPPGDSAILQAMTEGKSQGVDPLAIRQAIKLVHRSIAELHKDGLNDLYRELAEPVPFKPDAKGAGRRALKNCCMALLAAAPDLSVIRRAVDQLENATNMTEELGALLTLVRLGGHEADAALQNFYNKWIDNPLVIDKWFAANAQAGGSGALDKIKELTGHPAYKGHNPNRIRALIGGFAVGNPENFHRLDGSGYRFVADNVIAVDRVNPQVAARLLGVFEIWNKLDDVRGRLIQDELRRILAQKPSANVTEIATKSLGE